MAKAVVPLAGERLAAANVPDQLLECDGKVCRQVGYRLVCELRAQSSSA